MNARKAVIEQQLETCTYLVGHLEWLVGRKLFPYQFQEAQKIFFSVLTGAGWEITELWARQIGKTEMARCVLLTCMLFLPAWANNATMCRIFPALKQFREGFWVGLVGPKLQTAQLPFMRIREALSKRGSILSKNINHLGIKITTSNSTHLVFSNGSRALALSGSDTAFSEGETLHYLHFEETQRLSQFMIHKSFHPMVASTGGTICKVGTPDRRKGAFYDSIERNKRFYPTRHGEYDWHKGAAANPAYRRTVMQDMERMGGEDSDSFRMAYRLHWLLERGMMFSVDIWDSMMGNGQEGRPLIEQGNFTEGHRRVYGGDFAKYADATVITAGEVWGDHLAVVDVLRLVGVNYEDQYEIIGNWMKGHGPMDHISFVPDATGVGDPVVEGLKARGGIPENNITPLVYTATSKDELFKLLHTESRAKRLFYPGKWHDDRLFHPKYGTFHKENLECEQEQRGNLMTFHAPVGRDDGEVAHDDHTCSLANTLYAALRVPAPGPRWGFKF